MCGHTAASLESFQPLEVSDCTVWASTKAFTAMGRNTEGELSTGNPTPRDRTENGGLSQNALNTKSAVAHIQGQCPPATL